MDGLAGIVELLLWGLGTTVGVFLGAVLLALLTAVALGAATAARPRILRWPAQAIVEVVRGTSAIVQLFWVFFALPAFGITLPPLLAGIVVLGINSGAYGAEVVRGALGAVDRGQRDAAAAIGLTGFAAWWRIILPQAWPRMLPPFGNLAIELLKNTALVSLVNLSDLMFQGQTLRASTLRDVPIFLSLFVIYLVLALVVVVGMHLAERRSGRWRAGI